MGMEGMRFETGMGQTPKNTHESDMETVDSKVIEGVAFSHSSVWGRVLDGALEKILQQSGIDTGNKDLILRRMGNVVLEKLHGNASELQLMTLSWTNSIEQARQEDVEKIETRMENNLVAFIRNVFDQEKSDLIRMATEGAAEKLQ